MLIEPFVLSSSTDEREDSYVDIRQWTEMPRGGHFAASEQPELFVEDVRSLFRDLR